MVCLMGVAAKSKFDTSRGSGWFPPDLRDERRIGRQVAMRFTRSTFTERH